MNRRLFAMIASLLAVFTFMPRAGAQNYPPTEPLVVIVGQANLEILLPTGCAPGTPVTITAADGSVIAITTTPPLYSRLNVSLPTQPTSSITATCQRSNGTALVVTTLVAVPAAATPVPAAPPTQPPPAPRLAITGVETTDMAMMGIGVVGLGLVLHGQARRRSRLEQDPPR